MNASSLAAIVITVYEPHVRYHADAAFFGLADALCAMLHQGPIALRSKLLAAYQLY